MLTLYLRQKWDENTFEIKSNLLRMLCIINNTFIKQHLDIKSIFVSIPPKLDNYRWIHNLLPNQWTSDITDFRCKIKLKRLHTGVLDPDMTGNFTLIWRFVISCIFQLIFQSKRFLRCSVKLISKKTVWNKIR